MWWLVLFFQWFLYLCVMSVKAYYYICKAIFWNLPKLIISLFKKN